jgi:excisionase family DNA binding protein
MAADGSATKEVMDIRDLAAYLGIGKSKIYALIHERKIPASRIGRQYRFSKAVVDAWLRERLITAEPAPGTMLFDGAPSERA